MWLAVVTICMGFRDCYKVELNGYDNAYSCERVADAYEETIRVTVPVSYLIVTRTCVQTRKDRQWTGLE